MCCSSFPTIPTSESCSTARTCGSGWPGSSVMTTYAGTFCKSFTTKGPCDGSISSYISSPQPNRGQLAEKKSFSSFLNDHAAFHYPGYLLQHPYVLQRIASDRN